MKEVANKEILYRNVRVFIGKLERTTRYLVSSIGSLTEKGEPKVDGTRILSVALMQATSRSHTKS
jgi:predicted ATP-grasp superfamily ATP-dependent carboligase